MALTPGDSVRLEMTKWGDQPHWEMDAVYLGADAAGDWIGFPFGTVMSRPGMSITTTNEQVGLVPAAGTTGRQTLIRPRLDWVLFRRRRWTECEGSTDVLGTSIVALWVVT